jgi:hypothetical protein
MAIPFPEPEDKDYINPEEFFRIVPSQTRPGTFAELADNYANEARAYMVLCSKLIYLASSLKRQMHPGEQKELEQLKKEFTDLTAKL